MSTERKYFGTMPDGTNVDCCILAKGQTKVTLIEYGARIADINYRGFQTIGGFHTLEGYLKDTEHQGSTIGRYANRIKDGLFTLNGTQYVLAKNEGGVTHLHGGNVGYDVRVWKLTKIEETDDVARATFTIVSEDGEEGYPGKLDISVTFSLTNDNAFTIDYSATTDKDTVISMTNHSYFCISGCGESILDQILTIDSDKFVAVDDLLIPTGLADVEGTYFDFRKPKAIGCDIDKFDDIQLKRGGGYDHCWVLNHSSKDSPVASLYSPLSKINVDVYTTEDGIQVYAGNRMDEDNPFYGKFIQKPRYCVCMECCARPDSPNQKDFPSVVLKAGETYTQTTTYKYSTK
ncbi:MAG: galactose mutarotase [Clostridia bacterium]|nr:galactose mutarotase [Clostridia bacterium]